MLLRSRAGEPGFRILTFVLAADQPAGPVSVVGNFNDWTPGAHLLVPGPRGWRSASVTVPDDYIAVFRYLGDQGRWFDEPDADFVDGGGSVVLGVKGVGYEMRTSMTPAQRAVFTAAKKARKAAKKIEKARRRKRHKIESLLEKAVRGEAGRAHAERARAERGAVDGRPQPGGAVPPGDA